MKWVSKRDLVIIAALLFAALLLLLLHKPKNGTGYEILNGGSVIRSGSLMVEDEFSVNNVTFTVKHSRIAITQAVCPDKTCIRTGFIGSPGQITACLPNGLMVRVIGESGVDAVL
ncbi:MAG: NusG domain II-containing protein [Oscillospiraceae bacterium]|nr:NusG domain II-containing protein [Oscillospiraceae bacterium]